MAGDYRVAGDRLEDLGKRVEDLSKRVEQGQDKGFSLSGKFQGL